MTLDERPTLPLSSPSYLVGHPDGPWAFAVSEGRSEHAEQPVEIDWDGKLTRAVHACATGGDGACHLALSADSRFVLVAHYSSGSIASFAIGEDGTLTERIDLLQFEGSGPTRERQESAHAHQIVVDGERAAGLRPRLRRHPPGPTRAGRGHPQPTRPTRFELPAGSGPRHLVLVDDFVVVACELSARAVVRPPPPTTVDDWEHLRTVATSASGADLIQPSGIVAVDNRVFVANRGADTIAVFDVETARGWLTRVTEFDCGGAWPRDLTVRDRSAVGQQRAQRPDQRVRHQSAAADRAGVRDRLAQPRVRPAAARRRRIVTVVELRTGGTVRPITRWGTPVMHAPDPPGDRVRRGDCRIWCGTCSPPCRPPRVSGWRRTRSGSTWPSSSTTVPTTTTCGTPGCCCNPTVILPEGKDRVLDAADEGCLSLPGAYQELSRPDHAICRGQDETGAEVEVTGTGLLARLPAARDRSPQRHRVRRPAPQPGPQEAVLPARGPGRQISGRLAGLPEGRRLTSATASAPRALVRTPGSCLWT